MQKIFLHPPVFQQNKKMLLPICLSTKKKEATTCVQASCQLKTLVCFLLLVTGREKKSQAKKAAAETHSCTIWGQLSQLSFKTGNKFIVLCIKVNQLPTHKSDLVQETFFPWPPAILLDWNQGVAKNVDSIIHKEIALLSEVGPERLHSLTLFSHDTLLTAIKVACTAWCDFAQVQLRTIKFCSGMVEFNSQVISFSFI